jgi:dienelactone hydrolase
MALARTGKYVVCAIQADGATSWSNPRVMTAINAAVTAMRTKGAKTGKYGLLGWSMGGLETANQIKRDSANIAAAWTWAPAIDLDYIFSTAGHTPIANNATWTSEATTAFGSYAASAGYRVWDEPASYRSLGVPWKICHATDDTMVPQSISTSFVTAVADSNITMRTPDVTGNHTGLFSNIPDSEIVAHFDSGNW